MEALRDKKNIKLVSLIVAAVFILGLVGMALVQPVSVGMAATGNSAVGVVSYQVLASQHPDMKTLQEQIQAEVAAAKSEFESKAASMNQEEQQRYYMQLQERIATKEQSLIAPVLAKIDEAIKKVADSKGLTVVVDKQGVVYGGTDITDEVVKAFK